MKMNSPSFHRTNLNLYTEDVIYLQLRYGRGWTEQAREIIHKHIKIKKEMASHVGITQQFYIIDEASEIPQEIYQGPTFTYKQWRKSNAK
jgi:hypothetical protein